MGLKDHLEEDGAGRILDLGLDLEYLHIEGSVSRQAGADTGPSTERGEEEEEACEGSGNCILSTPGGKEREVVGEESAGFDSDPEPARNSTGSNPAEGVSLSKLEGGVPVPNTHQPLCRTPCVDLGSEGPPDPPSGEPSPGEALREYQSKLEFALKLGYAEELVRLVLAKLGPYTLINDILGELVKLGSKAETNQQLTGSTASQPAPSSSSSSSSSSSTCGYVEAVEVQQGRSDSPYQTDLLLGDKDNLRPVVLDGSNVAMSHGNKEVFSCYGIQLAVDWFLERGHRDITVFVPSWKKEQSRPDALITDQDILRRLEKDKILVFTPSRRVQGRRVVCYDDRFIVKLAYESDGIIVSNDNYRDLASEKPEWKKLIDERLLMYSFVNDKFMPPDDPLGRHGPSLENFLRKRPIMPEHKKQPCPYGKKCTYGHKCKYYHPERSAQCQRSVADELRATAKTSATSTSAKGQAGEAGLVKSHSVPNNVAMGTKRGSASKRQCDPSIRALSYGEAEDKLRHAEKCNSLSSSSGSVTLSPAPGGPPTFALSDAQEQPLSLGRDTPYMTLPPPNPDPYSSSCDPPDLSYYSVTPAHSGLAARRSPECRFPLDTDLRLLGSSDCGSSGCDSYGERASCLCCPGPLLDKYIHRQHHQHHHHQHNRLYSQHSAPLLEPHHPHPFPHTHTSALHGYHQNLARGHSLPHDEPPDPHLKRPLYPLPPPLQHQAVGARSSCPGDYPSVSQSGQYPAGSPLGCCLANTRLETLSDSRLYVRSPLPPRKAFSWDLYCSQPPQSRFETYQSLPETHDVGWGHTSPWGQTTHSYHPPYSPHSSKPPHPSHAPQPSHLSMPPQHMHQEPPALSRYGEVRGKVYLNLCNIFPSELVGRVMGRNPHVTDAQQLAAAILAEKSQSGY